MAETASELPLTRSATEGPAFEQLIRFQCSMLVAQQVRDQFWLTLTSLGLGALVAVEAGNFMIRAGYLVFPLSTPGNATGLYQAATVAILILVGIVFLYGRMRLVRSEMELLRLKLELISEDNGIPAPEESGKSPAALLLGRKPGTKRAIDLGPDS